MQLHVFFDKSLLRKQASTSAVKASLMGLIGSARRACVRKQPGWLERQIGLLVTGLKQQPSQMPSFEKLQEQPQGLEYRQPQGLEYRQPQGL